MRARPSAPRLARDQGCWPPARRRTPRSLPPGLRRDAPTRPTGAGHASPAHRRVRADPGRPRRGSPRAHRCDGPRRYDVPRHEPTVDPYRRHDERRDRSSGAHPARDGRLRRRGTGDRHRDLERAFRTGPLAGPDGRRASGGRDRRLHRCAPHQDRSAAVPPASLRNPGGRRTIAPRDGPRQMREAGLGTSRSPALSGSRHPPPGGAADQRSATTHGPTPAEDQLGGRCRCDGRRGDRRLENGRGVPWDESYFRNREARRGQKAGSRPENEKRTARRRSSSKAKSGGDLLSQAVSHQVPSAREGLTSVFGMGTGVTPPP